MQKQFCTRMICTKCKNKMHVVDSRPRERGTYRRYQCRECGERRSTTEVPTEWHDRAKAALDMLVDLRHNIDRAIY